MTQQRWDCRNIGVAGIRAMAGRCRLTRVACASLMAMTLPLLILGAQTPPVAGQNNGPGMGREVKDASSVLETYCELERRQKYAQIYMMLSRRYKQYLERFGVYDAAQYRRLRVSSEAGWSDFVIEHRSAEGVCKFLFTGTARVEESGEVQTVRFTVILVKEEGKWKVDDWKY